MAGPSFKIRVGDKEVEINEDTIRILRRYVRTEMTLEQLAAELGLDSWEEAYEFIKKVPAWLLWITPSMWRTLRELREVKLEA